jgi:RNA polymerase sigma factor (sigma-70 family)
LAAAVMDTTVTLGRQRVKIFRPQKIKRKDGRVVIRHSLLVRHNGRLLRHTGFRCWFGARYPRRWNSAASSYLDIRIAGKATSRLDITWIQAAAAEQPLDYLDTRQTPNACVSGNKKISDLKSFSLDEAHSQAQEDAAALTAYLWDYRRLYNEAQKKPPILGFFLLWLAAGLRKEEEYGPHKPKARRLAPTIGSNIYWHRLDDGTRVAKLVTLNELLDEDIIKESRARDANPRRAGRTALLEPEEELELARRGKAGDIAARDKIIVHHRPLVERVGFETIPGPIWRDMRDDIVQVGMESLTKVWGDWDPEFGVRFGSFAAGAIEWDMKDWLDQYYRQVPVDRSINVNIPMDNANDEDDDDDHKKEGAIDMTNAVYEAKRRLVAERMGCLDSRERRVIEGRLALNGGTKAVRLAALARELGVSESRVRQIEDEAAAKLQLAVL